MTPAEAWREVLAQLLSLRLSELSPADALEAVVALERAKTEALRAALRSEAPQLLTLDEAADLAAVPVRRVRSWARGKAWARHISRRTLRVDGPQFRAWLDARAAGAEAAGQGLEALGREVARQKAARLAAHVHNGTQGAPAGRRTGPGRSQR